MLTKLDLFNFQVHKRLSSDISPITVIGGKSDSGKSSIVRCLQWLLYNKGSARDFLRHGATDVMVTAEIDGRTLSRSSQHNSYTMDGVQSRVVGKGVPDDIVTFLNVMPDNTQSQHDPFYWFNENGSGLVSKIEETFGLKLPAEWVQTCKQEQNQTSRDLKRYEQETQDLTQEIAVLEQYVQAHDRVGKIDTILDELSLNQNQYDLLQKLSGGLIRYKMAVIPDSVWALCDCLVDALTKRQKLHDLARKHAELKEGIVSLPNMNRLQEAFDDNQSSKNRLDRLVTLTQAHKTASMVRPIPNYLSLLDALKSLLRCSEQFSEYGKRKAHVAIAQKNLEESQTQLQSLVGSTCPTCGGSISM
jgi:DNA repair exonuclease SbcCD ATPase subunit